MESIVNPPGEIERPDTLFRSENRDSEVLKIVASYLSKWKFWDRNTLDGCAREIVAAAQDRIENEPGLGLNDAAISEADALLRHQWKQMFPEGSFDVENGVPLELRQAAVLAPLEVRDTEALKAAVRVGKPLVTLALHPTRPAETQLIRMKTSLSRLPSLRLISAWILLIALLFLAFLLTH